MRDQAIRSGERLTASFAHVIAEQTNSALQTINQRLQLAASHLAPLMAGDRDEGAARKLLAEQVRELPYVRDLSAADGQGRIVYSTAGEVVNQTVIDREYFQTSANARSTGCVTARDRVVLGWTEAVSGPERLLRPVSLDDGLAMTSTFVTARRPSSRCPHLRHCEEAVEKLPTKQSPDLGDCFARLPSTTGSQ